MGEIWTVAFAPDGKTLAAGRSSRHAGSEVLLWRGATARQNRPAAGSVEPAGAGRRMFLSGHAGAINGLAYAPDGSFLASGSDDASVILWDPASGTERRRLTGHSGPVDAVAVSPDSRLVASGAGDWHEPEYPRRAVAVGCRDRRASGRAVRTLGGPSSHWPSPAMAGSWPPVHWTAR